MINSIVIVLVAISATPFVFNQQSLAQEQQLQSQSNRTAFDTRHLIEDLTFEIDNTTFSRRFCSTIARMATNMVLMAPCYADFGQKLYGHCS